MWQIEFFSFWIIFCPFNPQSPINNPKNQNFEKMKIIILHKCTINDNHMIYGSWDIDCNRFFLSSWAIFCPFTPPPHPSNSTKNQNFIKWNKNTLRYIILHKCTKKHYHILYCSWDMACDTCNFYFSFYAIFCILTPPTAQKIKISKKWKKMPGNIIILH